MKLITSAFGQEEDVNISNVGNWKPPFAPPNPTFHVSSDEYSAAFDAMSKAGNFASTIAEGQDLVKRATNPATAMDSDTFYDQIDALFRKLMTNEMEPRLALIGLAGASGAFVRGGLAVSPDAIKAMADKGFPVKANPNGADFSFVAGSPPTSPDILAAIPNISDQTGDWMTRKTG
jgi:hypothetical protein